VSSTAGPPQAESRNLGSRFRRRLVHYVVIGIGTLALTIVFMRLFPKRDFISQLSIGTAYPALFLTAAAMLLGPFNVLWQKPNPVSFDLRRDLGIWAGITALLHTLVGLNVHLRGRMWLYFVDEHHRLRRDAFGLGNYAGAIAAVVFLLLLTLSNDLSLRKLGAQRWKFLQQWAYAGAILTAAHAIAYQHVEKRISPFQAVFYATVGILLAFQLFGVFKSRQKRVMT
jgi:sulfoxide reductase heme-binding subunit YedZ